MQTSVLPALLVCLCYCGMVWTRLTVLPNTTVGNIGEQTYFNCSTDVTSKLIHWKHGNEYVYAGGSMHGSYAVRFNIENPTVGTYNLVITKVKAEDSGEYSCQDDGGHGQAHSVELIVLEGDPVCSAPEPPTGFIGPNSCGIQPNKIELKCKLNYHGIQPQMIWKKSGGDDLISNGVTNKANGSQADYILVMNADLSSTSQSYFCETTQSAGKDEYRCRSITIPKISYVFSDNSVVNKYRGDEVICSANSSVSCSYKWTKSDNGKEITVSSEKMIKPDDPGRYRCEARCSLGSNTCTVTAMTVDVVTTMTVDVVTGMTVDVSSAEESTGHGLEFLALLVIPVVLIMVVLVIVLLKRKKRKSKRNHPANDQHIAETPESMAPLVSLQGGNDTVMKEHPQRVVPVYLEEIKVKSQGKPIVGLALTKNRLYVLMKNAPTLETGQGSEVRSGNKPEKEKESYLEIYETSDLSFVEECPITNTVHPWDVASCENSDCIYISDYKAKDSKEREIIKFNPNCLSRSSWSTGEDYGNLSVTSESHIILSSPPKKKLIEYNQDGNIIHEIDLPLHHPHHAIKLANGQFVVCHGFENDSEHRVCSVDEKGTMKKSFGGKAGLSSSQMNQPRYLAIDTDKSILVADNMNDRVLLLSSNLEFEQELLKDHLFFPVKVYLCQSDRKIFVLSLNRNVLAFSIK